MNSRHDQSSLGSRTTSGRAGSFEPTSSSLESRSQADELRSEARELGRRGSHAVREQVDDLARSGRRLASDLTQEVRQRASSIADDNRLRAARQCRVMCDSLGRASERFRESNDQTVVADYIDAASDTLSRVGDYFEHSDLDLMVNDARSFTRRNSGLVLGGLFALGLAVGRLLTASQKALDSGPEDLPYEGPGSQSFESRRPLPVEHRPMSHEARMQERARNLRSVAVSPQPTSPHGDPHRSEIRDTPQRQGSLHTSSTLSRESNATPSGNRPDTSGRPEVRR